MAPGLSILNTSVLTTSRPDGDIQTDQAKRDVGVFSPRCASGVTAVTQTRPPAMTGEDHPAAHRHLPYDVLCLAPLDRQSGFRRVPLAGRTTKLRPVL